MCKNTGNENDYKRNKWEQNKCQAHNFHRNILCFLIMANTKNNIQIKIKKVQNDKQDMSSH